MDNSKVATKAANQVLASRDVVTRSKARTRPSRQTTPSKPISIRQAAQTYGISKWEVEQAIGRIQGKVGPQGRPLYLLSHESDTLAAFIELRHETNFAVVRGDVILAAHEIKKRRVAESGPPSKAWYLTWKAAHPESHITPTIPNSKKGIPPGRQVFEASDPASVALFHQHLGQIFGQQQALRVGRVKK